MFKSIKKKKKISFFQTKMLFCIICTVNKKYQKQSLSAIYTDNILLEGKCLPVDKYGELNVLFFSSFVQSLNNLKKN